MLLTVWPTLSFCAVRPASVDGTLQTVGVYLAMVPALANIGNPAGYYTLPNSASNEYGNSQAYAVENPPFSHDIAAFTPGSNLAQPQEVCFSQAIMQSYQSAPPTGIMTTQTSSQRDITLLTEVASASTHQDPPGALANNTPAMAPTSGSAFGQDQAITSPPLQTFYGDHETNGIGNASPSFCVPSPVSANVSPQYGMTSVSNPWISGTRQLHGGMKKATAELDVVFPNQKPPVAKRGPFSNKQKREQTAETRKIGSCIRCRMQRIRVSVLECISYHDKSSQGDSQVPAAAKQYILRYFTKLTSRASARPTRRISREHASLAGPNTAPRSGGFHVFA